MNRPDFADPSFETMFANFGLTSLAATSLEKTVMLLFLAANRVASLDTPAPALYKAVNEYNKKTLGNLITLLKSKVNLPDSFATNLDVALERRNHLTHHFFFEHLNDLQSSTGAKKMSDELLPIRDQLVVAQQQADAALGMILKTRKLDLKEIDVEVAALIKNEGAG